MKPKDTFYAFDGAHNGSKKEHQLKMNNQGDEFLLNGSAMFVPYAEISDYVICRALDDFTLCGTSFSRLHSLFPYRHKLRLSFMFNGNVALIALLKIV